RRSSHSAGHCLQLHVRFDRRRLTLPAGMAILNHMVYYSDPELDQAFAPFAVSLPAIMKHLDVLARAGLIERAKTGRTVRCTLKAQPMETALQWLTRYERFWSKQLDALARFVEEESCPNPNAQASPSSASSTRARKKSSPPGRTRKR